MTKKRITLRDVAQVAGVHASTVSRALDPRTRPLINAAMVQRILEISERLNYRPNAAALSLRTNRSRTIGVIVPDIENPIFPPMIRGIESALLARGYFAIMGNTDGEESRERDLVNGFTSRGIDGLILASVNREDAVAHSAALAGTPIVTANRRLDDPAISSVVHQEDNGILRVLTHLVSLGHHRVAVIAGPQSTSTGADRYNAYLHHREALGVSDDPLLICFANSYSSTEGERCLEELVARGTAFTAILCANDQLAVGAIAGLERRNLSCPGDVSVTGYNDMPMMDRIQPPMTTVRIRQFEMGLKAGNIIQSMIEGSQEPQHVVLPVELIIRGSTRAIAPSERD